MNSDKISDAIGLIDDKLIMEAAKSRKKRNNRKQNLLKWMAAAACICIVVFGISEKIKPTEVSAIARAEYPEMILFPKYEDFVDEKTGKPDNDAYEEAHDAWYQGRLARMTQPEEYKEGLGEFITLTSCQFLSDAGNENIVYSPLNVYMALGILAEAADGDSRQQILALLDAENIDTMRERASALWNAVYCKDGTMNSVMANSIWLNEDIDYTQSTLDTLSKVYYASSYQGRMGSEQINESLQSWLAVQTGNLLSDGQTEDIELSSNTILAMISTVCFQAKWMNKFVPDETSEGIFYSSDEDVTCDFMHKNNDQAYYWGEDFSSVRLYLNGGGSVWFILPDEGVTVDELLFQEELQQFYVAGENWENNQFITVHMAVPQFDVYSEVNLKNGLAELGITDIFSKEKADFSSMAEDSDGIFLSDIEHAVRVRIDEEGCAADAAFLDNSGGMGGAAEEEVDFILDRPFLFMIMGPDDSPLFIGVVNRPA